jgi:murein DD-endopeptidase MepM/ murein hydrolase activator NlpD
MQRTRKRLCRLLPVVLAVILLLPALPAVRADDASDLKALAAKQADLAAAQQNAQSALERVYYQRDETKVKLQLTENQLANANAQVKTVGAQLKETQDSLAKLQTEVKLTEESYRQQKARFGERLRAVQEMGPVSYAGVLMGSSSFADFISRWDRITVIVRHDNGVIAAIKATKSALEAQRQEVANKEAAQKQLLTQAEGARQTVQAKLAELTQLKADLTAQEASLHAQVATYEQELDAVEEQIYAIQVRMKRAAGKFAPASPMRGRHEVTAEFGFGPDPIRGGTRNHGGIDLAANTGTQILAIEDGVVIYTGYDSIYGNRVVIDHGGGVASWYGHSSKILVRVDQAVKQGEAIALVGSTGMSTGPHLHLEIRVNNIRQQPRDYIDF